MKDKCLVTKAMEECQCDNCKWDRDLYQLSLEFEAQKIILLEKFDAIKNK